ncbi:MAG: hypothetical protein P8Z38_06910 [Robiginitalea sp.]|jgi:hypothetical protein
MRRRFVHFPRYSSTVFRLNLFKTRSPYQTLLLFFMVLGQGFAQSESAIPLNALNAKALQSIEINGISFGKLSRSQGDEGVIASLCQCPYTVLKSEDPDFPWAAYTLFEGENRFSVSFGGDGTSAMAISNMELLGTEATVTLRGVTLSRGDRMDKLGLVQSQRQFGGGSLHFALFSAGARDSFFHIDFEPDSGEIQKIGYMVPF